MNDTEATLGHHFFQIPQAEIAGQIPTDAQQHHRTVEMTAFEDRAAPRKPSRPVPQSRNRIICDRTANTAATLDGGPSASDVFTPGRDRPEGHGVAPGVHAVRRWRASPGETGLRKRAPAAHVTDVTSTAPPSGSVMGCRSLVISLCQPEWDPVRRRDEQRRRF